MRDAAFVCAVIFDFVWPQPRHVTYTRVLTGKLLQRLPLRPLDAIGLAPPRAAESSGFTQPSTERSASKSPANPRIVRRTTG